MKLDISALMMIFFIIFLVISIWKIYAFLPNKELVDDDTTEASQKELMDLVLKFIKLSEGNLTKENLFKMIKNDANFDEKHFWRFNLNKLNQLLNHYYLENPNCTTIKEIYTNTKD